VWSAVTAEVVGAGSGLWDSVAALLRRLLSLWWLVVYTKRASSWLPVDIANNNSAKTAGI